MTTEPITLPTELLLAMSRLASPEHEHKLNVVVFKRDEMIVCNGHVLVRIARENDVNNRGKTVDSYESFGMGRQHIEMAVAAQDRRCANIQPDHPPDYEPENWQFHRCRDLRDRSGRDLKLIIELGSAHVDIDVGGAMLRVARRSVTDYPPIDQVMPTKAEGTPPNGIGMNGKYIAEVDAIARAGRWHGNGLCLEAWGGPLDPLLFTAGPMRVVLMPMRT